MRGGPYNVAKRALDVTLALAGVFALAPLMLLIAGLVKASSRGPVIYRGVRTGQFGKPFQIWKFRTMIADAEKLGGTTTGHDDPRITAIGRTLRDYKLDELPQLFNVLAGDMSFVGPRPEVSEYTDLYTSEQQKILDVRPGITDLSSLEFHDLQQHVGAANPDRVFREHVLARKNALRMTYVERRSLAVDLSILLRTVWLVLGKPFRRGGPTWTP